MKSKNIISSFILVITLFVFSNQCTYEINETWYKENTYSASYHSVSIQYNAFLFSKICYLTL